MPVPPADEPIHMWVRPGHTGSASPVDIKVPPQYAEALLAALDEAEVHHGEVLEFSVTDEVLLIFALTGSIKAISLALQSFWHRNDGRRVEIVGPASDRVIVQGESHKEVLELLERMEEQKRANERAWAEMMDRANEDD